MNVKGVSIKEILSSVTPESVSKLSEKDLRTVTNRLVSAANKRIRRAEAAGRKGYVYASLEASGGKFSIAGKSFNQTRAEFTRLYNFLNAETSTAAGYKKAVTAAEARFKKQTGIDPSELTKSQIEEYYSQINKFREQYPDRQLKYDEKALAQMIKEGADSGDVEIAMRETMQTNYEQMMEQEAMEDFEAMQQIQGMNDEVMEEDEENKRFKFLD